MASELVGRVEDAHGWTTQVRRSPDGTVIIKSPLVAVHDAASLTALRELLDRAARPGQEGRRDDGEAPTREEVDRCGYSEDPYHRCRVCYDYAAEREREHPLTAGEVPSE